MRIDAGLLLLRIGIGVMFMLHGWPKIAGGPERWAQVGQAVGHLGIHVAPAFWGFLAACSEFFGGLCLLLGLGTRIAAVMMAGTMAVAATMHLRQGDGIQVASHAIEAGVVFLSLLLLGAGRHSLDHRLRRRRGAGS
jgi:putative oxidoreductase